MKKIEKLNLKNASELSNNEMKDLFGGISKEEYCAELWKMMQNHYNGENWSTNEWASAANAWNANCKN